jgi:3-hydroxy-9,10-secoandrosta-1,3,5(10)-triene-9,17-dione monooxygenase reductase component
VLLARSHASEGFSPVSEEADFGVIESSRFRRALGAFPSGVTVVTGRDELGPVGLTVQSFCSLSLDPPLVLLCPSLTSTSWPRISANGKLCVNILADHQGDVCRQLGRSGPRKFDGVVHAPSPRFGLPVIEGAAGWLECVVNSEADGGDHLVVTARVVSLSEPTDASPLMFWRGQFTRLVTD